MLLPQINAAVETPSYLCSYNYNQLRITVPKVLNLSYLGVASTGKMIWNSAPSPIVDVTKIFPS